KGELVKQLNVTLGKMKANGLKVVDFAASLNDIEQGVLANAKPHFLTLGIEILQISGMNIPLPDSIKEALEKMASAKVLGRTSAAGSKPCIKCGKRVPPGLKSCGECGAAQTLKCPDGHDVPGNMKFCPECGKPVKS